MLKKKVKKVKREDVKRVPEALSPAYNNLTLDDLKAVCLQRDKLFQEVHELRIFKKRILYALKPMMGEILESLHERPKGPAIGQVLPLPEEDNSQTSCKLCKE